MEQDELRKKVMDDTEKVFNPDTFIDKLSWPDGPWKKEPDVVQWVDEATGFPCLMVRNVHMGHWCGYVGVPAGHKWHGMHYDAVGADVHGGLTFAQMSYRKTERKPLGMSDRFYYREEGSEVWWLGFDCAHSGDLSPSMQSFGGVYRDLPFVKAECESLALQAKSA